MAVPPCANIVSAADVAAVVSNSNNVSEDAIMVIIFIVWLLSNMNRFTSNYLLFNFLSARNIYLCFTSVPRYI